jgi:hypothetical protein
MPTEIGLLCPGSVFGFAIFRPRGRRPPRAATAGLRFGAGLRIPSVGVRSAAPGGGIQRHHRIVPPPRSFPCPARRAQNRVCSIRVPAHPEGPLKRTVPYSDYPIYPVSIALAIISAAAVAGRRFPASQAGRPPCCRQATRHAKVAPQPAEGHCDRVSTTKAACGSARGMLVTLQLPGQRRSVRPADGLYIDVVVRYTPDLHIYVTQRRDERCEGRDGRRSHGAQGWTRRSSDDRVGESAARPC